MTAKVREALYALLDKARGTACEAQAYALAEAMFREEDTLKKDGFWAGENIGVMDGSPKGIETPYYIADGAAHDCMIRYNWAGEATDPHGLTRNNYTPIPCTCEAVPAIGKIA